MNIYYVDTENIGSRKWNYLIKELEPGDCVAVFYSDKANTMSTDTLHALQSKKAKVKYIYSYPGRKGGNAMDFQITAMLGYGIAKLGKRAGYRVISNDNGYNPVATYWRQYGYDVEVIHPDINIVSNKSSSFITETATQNGQKNIKEIRNELMQRGVSESEARLIASMMVAASKKERKIRCVSMHSRLNERFGRSHGDKLYNQLEKYFIKILQQQGKE